MVSKWRVESDETEEVGKDQKHDYSLWDSVSCWMFAENGFMILLNILY